jgi:hypothetical protein
MSVFHAPILYVNLDTINRLIATGRVRVTSIDGIVTTVFPPNDPLYPEATLQVSSDVFGNAVHRKVYLTSQERHIFEFVGDV